MLSREISLQRSPKFSIGGRHFEQVLHGQAAKSDVIPSKRFCPGTRVCTGSNDWSSSLPIWARSWGCAAACCWQSFTTRAVAVVHIWLEVSSLFLTNERSVAHGFMIVTWTKYNSTGRPLQLKIDFKRSFVRFSGVSRNLCEWFTCWGLIILNKTN